MEKFKLSRTSVGNGVEEDEFLHTALEPTVHLENSLTILTKVEDVHIL